MGVLCADTFIYVWFTEFAKFLGCAYATRVETCMCPHTFKLNIYYLQLLCGVECADMSVLYCVLFMSNEQWETSHLFV